MDGPFRDRWNPFTDLDLFDKIDRLEDAIGAILEKVDLPSLENFGKKPPGKNEPAKEAEKVVVKEPEPYSYKELDVELRQIRVLELHPEEKNSNVLTGSMHYHSFEEGDELDSAALDLLDPDYMSKLTKLTEGPPAYNALSYTWGTPVMDSMILIDGQTLPITTSLKEALAVLRRGQWRSKRWWIDQICT
jgi:hypothetical protein